MLVTEDYFFTNLRNGLEKSSNVSYLRQCYLRVITFGVYNFSNIIEDSNLRDHVEKIFESYFRILESTDLPDDEDELDREILFENTELDSCRASLY